MRSANKIEDIWKHNKLLVSKRGENKLHFVCLEGSCGVGKSDILKRMEKMGFRIILNRFYDHAFDMHTTYHRVPVTGFINSILIVSFLR
jgi:hypothetical protein